MPITSASARRDADFHLQVLAERALRVEPIGQSLIDDRDHPIRAQVIVRDVAALDQSRARQRQISREHRLLAGHDAGVGHAFSRETAVVWVRHRQRRRGRHRFDAWQLTHLVDGAANQPQLAVEIGKGAEAHLDSRGHEAGRIETNRRMREVPERSQHQAAADQRHDRQRDFGDHERALQAADARRRRAAAAGFQRIRVLATRDPQRRNRPADQAHHR